MKKLITITFFSLAFLALSMMAQDIIFNNPLTLSKSNTYILIPTGKFVAPTQGTYTISFVANAVNKNERPAKVAVTTHVNNAPSAATISTSAFINRPNHISYTGNLALNKGDSVDFRIISSDDQLKLNTIDNLPSFKATITIKQ